MLKYRDIFDARVSAFVNKTQKYIQSAVIGEIGNNTFDHNFTFDDKHIRGTYFNYDYLENCVILADYGKGLLASLSKVTDVNNCLEALKIAFIKEVSSRINEKRGNGLKYVYNTVLTNKWDLYFQSGNGCCVIDNGISKFEETSDFLIGCFAVIKY